MTTYISLLRGINVSGQKSIKMADLRALYEKLGFENVKSYVQSGNVVFISDEPSNKIADAIRDGISEKYGFSVEVMVISADDWRELANANPYLNDSNIDPKHLHVTLLDNIPDEAHINSLENLDTRGDDYTIIENRIYLHCPNGYGRSKLTNNFWEKKLKVSATTRNWNTVNKLIALVDSMGES